jgi:hypothetical protein
MCVGCSIMFYVLFVYFFYLMYFSLIKKNIGLCIMFF